MLKNSTSAPLLPNGVLYGVDWVERWRMGGFNFPFFALQNITTWSTVHSRVCPECTQRLIREQRFLIVADCIAKDADWNTNDEIKDKNQIVDYVDYNHETKEWESVYGQKCSQCGAVANAV